MALKNEPKPLHQHSHFSVWNNFSYIQLLQFCNALLKLQRERKIGGLVGTKQELHAND